MIEHLPVEALASFEDRWHFSHLVSTRGLLYLSGVTGTAEDGSVDPDPRTQFGQAFEQLELYLGAAGATIADVVELTTYHVHLSAHLEVFCEVKDVHVPAPYPAWSAIGCSELITPGALVEIRAIAADPRV